MLGAVAGVRAGLDAQQMAQQQGEFCFLERACEAVQMRSGQYRVASSGVLTGLDAQQMAQQQGGINSLGGHVG